MQYDKDINSTIFRKLRKILLSFSEIKELKNAKQTSYSDEFGVIAMLRSKDDNMVIAFGKGSVLAEKYLQLQGDGKIVRHLSFKSIEDVNEKILREMIIESLVLNMEANEMKKLRKNIKEIDA
jgi:hypothetical protein